jgi:hypothetical protein
MKVETRTILGAALFLGITCGGYWILVATHGHASEYAGVVMLLFGFAAYGMLFGYLYLQYKRRRGHPRPEDRFDAVQADGAGEVGYFPSASIWPAGMGLGMIFGAAGAVWGLWYPIIGAILFFGSVIGWVVESDVPEDDPNLQSPH